MADFQPIAPITHAKLRWQRDGTYRFAAGEMLVALTLSELAQAALAMPIGFVEKDDAFSAVAILGIENGQNLFCDPSNGWQSPFVPKVLQTYPFKIGKFGERFVLCVDHHSGQISDDRGQPFFLEGETLNPDIAQVAESLKMLELGMTAAKSACFALKKHELIRAWPITLKASDNEKRVEGLFQVDERALNSLSGEALVDLRQTGALMMAYCQLLSTQHLAKFGQLIQSRAALQAAASNQTTPQNNQAFWGENETVSFAAFR